MWTRSDEAKIASASFEKPTEFGDLRIGVTGVRIQIEKTVMVYEPGSTSDHEAECSEYEEEDVVRVVLCPRAWSLDDPAVPAEEVGMTDSSVDWEKHQK